jgi:uncharacterized protein (DUF885 family)
MPRWLKVVLGLLGVLLAAAAVFLIPTVWFRPWTVDHLYTRSFLELAIRHPELLTQLGFLESKGIYYRADELDDYSLAFDEEETKLVDKNLKLLATYDRSKMSRDAQLSYDVFAWFLNNAKDNLRFRYHNYPVNQLFGVQSGIPDFIINTHPMRRPRDAENYVRRVERIAKAFDQVQEGLQRRDSLGIIPPRFVLVHVVAQMDSFIAKPARQNPLFETFHAKADSIPDLKPERKHELEERLASAIDSSVYPAYRKLNAFCRAQLARATTDDGAWKLPDGEAFYAQCLKNHTSTDMDAESIHTLGLAEVARIQAEMTRILRAQGYPGRDLPAEMQQLRHEPRFLYSNDDEGRRKILEDYRAILAEADSGLGPLFDVRPKASMKVERVPTFSEATSAGAYYQAGAVDGSRPGVFYANLQNLSESPRFSMRTLAYHEGIPGHHFQIAISQELKGVPFFRKVLPFTAYDEGWGLYAERLALEHGFHHTPFDSLGAFSAELLRAARLVVDTGIHHSRWTREQAIDWMRKNTGMGESGVIREVERYIVSPGQACAYKVGQLKILELRERARTALGPRFDIREFHNVVLTGGALPLSLLERRVDDWVKEKRGTAS